MCWYTYVPRALTLVKFEKKRNNFWFSSLGDLVAHSFQSSLATETMAPSIPLIIVPYLKKKKRIERKNPTIINPIDISFLFFLLYIDYKCLSIPLYSEKTLCFTFQSFFLSRFYKSNDVEIKIRKNKWKKKQNKTMSRFYNAPRMHREKDLSVWTANKWSAPSKCVSGSYRGENKRPHFFFVEQWTFKENV